MLSFFTPIVYDKNEKQSFSYRKRISRSIEQNIDSYFYLGGKRAHVILDIETQQETFKLKDLENHPFSKVIVGIDRPQ
jgi:hypothetical protein